MALHMWGISLRRYLPVPSLNSKLDFFWGEGVDFAERYDLGYKRAVCMSKFYVLCHFTLVH